MNAMSVLNAKMMAKAKAQRVLMKVLQEMMPAEDNNVSNIRLAERSTGASPATNASPAPTTGNIY